MYPLDRNQNLGRSLYCSAIVQFDNHRFMHDGVRQWNKPAGLHLPGSRPGRFDRMNKTGVDDCPVHAGYRVQHARTLGEGVPGMTLRRVGHALAPVDGVLQMCFGARLKF